jgi:CheY-like chemotaxis protein
MEQKKRAAEIVLIEDNPGDALLVKIALEENHIQYNLTEFSSGLDAIHQLTQSQENTFIPDVILLDLHTPRCDGFEVLSRLRQRFARVPMAVVSSSRARADRIRAEREGVSYFEKPTDLEAFIDRIGRSVKQMLETNRPELP